MHELVERELLLRVEATQLVGQLLRSPWVRLRLRAGAGAGAGARARVRGRVRVRARVG